MIGAAVRGADPNLPLPTVTRMSDVVARTRATPAFQTWLLGTFAVMAVLLTVVGLYGVLTYAVACRTREFGVRIALGAEPREILAIVGRRTLRLMTMGLGLGVGGAMVATRVLSTSLFQVTPTDPATFAGVVVLLAAAGCAAAAGPAWRATRVNPIEVLRAE